MEVTDSRTPFGRRPTAEYPVCACTPGTSPNRPFVSDPSATNTTRSSTSVPVYWASANVLAETERSFIPPVLNEP